MNHWFSIGEAKLAFTVQHVRRDAKWGPLIRATVAIPTNVPRSCTGKIHSALVLFLRGLTYELTAEYVAD